MDAKSLNPKDILADWSSKDIKALLTRAVFDPASYGRVRFHHRSVQELLCANWLLDLVKHGYLISRIWSLLAEEKYGKLRLRPSLRPVTAWLAQLNQEIQDRVAPLAPELLIEGGDPALLSSQARGRILTRFADLYQNCADACIKIDNNQLKYFADPKLENIIRGLWKGSEGSGELRLLLLRIVCCGKLQVCSDILLSAAKQGDGYEQVWGAMGIGKLGTKEQRQDLAAHLLKQAKSFPKKAFTEALQAGLSHRYFHFKILRN